MPKTQDPCLVHDHLPKSSVQTRYPGREERERERARERERERDKKDQESLADSSGQDMYNIGSRIYR
jgi:hypothetical protein